MTTHTTTAIGISNLLTDAITSDEHIQKKANKQLKEQTTNFLIISPPTMSIILNWQGFQKIRLFGVVIFWGFVVV